MTHSSIPQESTLDRNIMRYKGNENTYKLMEKVNRQFLDPLNNRLNRNSELLKNLSDLIKEKFRILAVDDMPYNINCI